MTWIETVLLTVVVVIAFNYLVYTAGYLWNKGKINAIKEQK